MYLVSFDFLKAFFFLSDTMACQGRRNIQISIRFSFHDVKQYSISHDDDDDVVGSYFRSSLFVVLGPAASFQRRAVGFTVLEKWKKKLKKVINYTTLHFHNKVHYHDREVVVFY